MTPNPLQRLKQQYPLLPQGEVAPQGMPLDYVQGVGDEAGGGDMQGAGGDIGALLGQYLKKRQGAGPAEAAAAWKAGGSL